jgi:hypothetical protein
MAAGSVRQRQHRRDRRRYAPDRSQHPLCRHLADRGEDLGPNEWRPGERHLEEYRRRRDLVAPDRQWSAHSAPWQSRIGDVASQSAARLRAHRDGQGRALEWCTDRHRLPLAIRRRRQSLAARQLESAISSRAPRTTRACGEHGQRRRGLLPCYWILGDARRRATMVQVGTGASPGFDNHDMWIDPLNGNRIIVGNDEGVSISITRGRSWNRIRLPIAQIYKVSTDNRVPYTVCGNMQDGPSRCGPSNSKSSGAVITGSAEIPRGLWYSVLGGESGAATPYPVNADIIWSTASGRGSVGGIVTRYNVRGRHRARRRSLAGEHPAATRRRTPPLVPTVIFDRSPPHPSAGDQALVTPAIRIVEAVRVRRIQQRDAGIERGANDGDGTSVIPIAAS